MKSEKLLSIDYIKNGATFLSLDKRRENVGILGVFQLCKKM